MTKKRIFLKPLLLFLIISIATFLQGQKIPQFDYPDQDSVTVYYNLNQKIKLKTFGSDPSFIKLKSSINRGVNLSQADSSFFVFINNPVEDLKLKLYYKNLPVDIINIKIERLPASELRFEIAENGEISKKKLAEVRKLLGGIPAKYTDELNLQIYSYNLNIIRNNQSVEVISCFNNVLSEQAIRKLISLPDDTEIMINNVRLKTTQNNVIELEGEGLKYLLK